MTSMRFIRLFAAAALVAATVSCGSVAREGRGGSFIVIDSLQGIRGAVTLAPASAVLVSDVITNVTSPPPCSTVAPCPTVFGDIGQAVMHIVMKDAGSASPTTASAINDITLFRYRVEYVRADGHNTPGVDIPYPFDGVITATVSSAQTTIGFDLVRTQAKLEVPLILLQANSAPIVTQLAKVTFYGRDQAGNEVTVTGNIQINFGNFGDI
jgi:hypothetical protein